jgi:SAM-dependent methyltransferase
MTTDYNRIGDLYRRAKEQPWRLRVEEPSMMRLIGDVRGKKIVDMACGEGFFTRRLKQAGADATVGFDISEEMITLAKAHEALDPLGVEYFVEDARSPDGHTAFDLAVSGWLLVYAHDRDELAVMSRGIASRVRPGGRFVTLTTNPDLYFFDPLPDYGKYGFEVGLADSVFEGAPITWTIHLDDETSFEIENYYLPVEALVGALREAGFRDVSVHPLALAPDPAAGDEGDYWADFVACPPAIMIDGIKA